MNWDLAMMALDGLMKSPITIRSDGDTVAIEGSPAGMKELARLCLLIAGEGSAEDAFELRRGVHVTGDSATLRLRTR
jgi:hypothetical protein